MVFCDWLFLLSKSKQVHPRWSLCISTLFLFIANNLLPNHSLLIHLSVYGHWCFLLFAAMNLHVLFFVATISSLWPRSFMFTCFMLNVFNSRFSGAHFKNEIKAQRDLFTNIKKYLLIFFPQRTFSYQRLKSGFELFFCLVPSWNFFSDWKKSQ